MSRPPASRTPPTRALCSAELPDDRAARRGAIIAACAAQRLQVAEQAPQLLDTSRRLPDVAVDQGVHVVAAAFGICSKTDQATNLSLSQIQPATIQDESKLIGMLRRVLPIVALRARRRGQKADALVVADRFDRNVETSRQLTNLKAHVQLFACVLDPEVTTGFSIQPREARLNETRLTMNEPVGSLTILRDACRQHVREAREHERAGRIDAAWAHLEAAHILGQRATRLHVASHWAMLTLAWRTRDRRELIGQIARLAGAAGVTWIWVPVGNSGRANVSAFARAPIPEDLANFLLEEKSRQ